MIEDKSADHKNDQCAGDKKQPSCCTRVVIEIPHTAIYGPEGYCVYDRPRLETCFDKEKAAELFHDYIGSNS